MVHVRSLKRELVTYLIVLLPTMLRSGGAN